MAWKKVVTESGIDGEISQTSSGLNSGEVLGSTFGGTGNGVPNKGQILIGNSAGNDWMDLSVGDNNKVLTANSSATGGISWETVPGAMSFQLEDAGGTELEIDDAKEVALLGTNGILTNWTNTSNGTDGDPYDMTISIDSSTTPIVTGLELLKGADRTIKVNDSTTGAGGNLIIQAAKGATGTDNGGIVEIKASRKSAAQTVLCYIDGNNEKSVFKKSLHLDKESSSDDSPTLRFVTNNGAADGDTWSVKAENTSDILNFTNNISGNQVSYLKIQPHFTPSSSKSTFAGGIIAGGNSTITGNLTVSGDFTVNGTNTIVSSTDLAVEDKHIILGTNSDGDNWGGGTSSSVDTAIVFGGINTTATNIDEGIKLVCDADGFQYDTSDLRSLLKVSHINDATFNNANDATPGTLSHIQAAAYVLDDTQGTLIHDSGNGVPMDGTLVTSGDELYIYYA